MAPLALCPARCIFCGIEHPTHEVNGNMWCDDCLPMIDILFGDRRTGVKHTGRQNSDFVKQRRALNERILNTLA